MGKKEKERFFSPGNNSFTFKCGTVLTKEEIIFTKMPLLQIHFHYLKYLPITVTVDIVGRILKLPFFSNVVSMRVDRLVIVSVKFGSIVTVVSVIDVISVVVVLITGTLK